MSNREKGAWAELIALILIWGVYFAGLVAAVGSGAIEEEGFASAMGVRFALCAVLSILVGIGSGVLGELLARRSNAPVRDEREAWAGLRATRIAHGTLIVLLLALCVLAFLFGAFAGETAAERANAFAAGSGEHLFALHSHHRSTRRRAQAGCESDQLQYHRQLAA